jgi:hypothetical protein
MVTVEIIPYKNTDEAIHIIKEYRENGYKNIQDIGSNLLYITKINKVNDGVVCWM